MTKRLAGVGAVWVKCSDCGYVHVFSKNTLNKGHNYYYCRKCGFKNTVEGLKK